jgi:hypothetical protein
VGPSNDVVDVLRRGPAPHAVAVYGASTRRLASQGADADALPALVAPMSQVAIDLSDTVAEIEINSLIVRVDGVDAVDAVVTLRSV